MSLGIAEILRPQLRDRSTRFVFPSKICAEAWLAESLEMGIGAIETDRFLGWDELKEAAGRKDRRQAADDFIRRIFSASLLARNASAPFLKAIIPPAYAGLWMPFSGYLASRLPALGRLPAAIRAAGGGARADPAAADWLEVRERYVSFLGRIGRFEPSYEPKALQELGGKTFVFFPELIEDFEDYREALEGIASMTLVPLPGSMEPLAGPLAGSARLRRPETALAELREVLSEAGALLDSGVEAERIAITVADLVRYRPYLEREAILLSVPLAIRSGSSLAASPGGRLFAALRDAYSTDFSFDAMRDLLLSPAWPWRGEWRGAPGAPGLGARIMEEGLRLHAVAPWPAGGKMVDAWEKSLSGELKTAYRRLKLRVSELASAPDFRALLKAYNAFRTEFLSPERADWDQAADLTLARCVVEMEGLTLAQAEAGLEVEDAFGLFMRGLESQPYVSSLVSAGIPVYEWRVAAGIAPERHFILGASQEGLAVPSRGFDFLGESLREELGRRLYGDPLAVDGDSGPAFIRAYALSGKSVSFSCPRSGFGGELAAHGFLVSLSAGEEAEPSRDSLYGDEAEWLSGRAEAPASLHPVQASGLAAAAAAPSGGSSSGAFLEASTAELVASRLRREDDPRLRLDSTAIDRYRSCPYAYLYLRLLEAEPESSGLAFVDAPFIGEVYHAALAALFARIREADGSFKPERAASYRSMIAGCLLESFAQLARNRGPFVAVALETYRGRLALYLENLVDAEAERFPGLDVGPLEEDFELDCPELAGGVVLRGRIDRISRSPLGAVVIDYKKGGLAAKAQVAPDEGGSIAEAQIPCYLTLVSGARGAGATGVAIDSAWYVSIEGDSRREAGSAACAFGGARGVQGAYVPGEGLEGFLAAFDRALGETALGISAGSFPLAPKETQGEACQSCGARGICRERYALRFDSGTPGERPAR
jgi:RecB family exonuclease